jgi:myo-inositol-1(or 4)-monophosphatase
MQNILATAIQAAREAGDLLRSNFGSAPDVAAAYQHDIKLDLDVQCQDLITDVILKAFPDHAIYGEEGVSGNQASPWQWIIDPIDGTVNYFYGIPHFCISIAARLNNEIQVGVILDPMRNELWETHVGAPTLLNGKPVRVSTRNRLEDAAVSVGMTKDASRMSTATATLEKFVHRVRKCRLMGSAALDLAYVACGRLDAYIESSVNLWDIAAGKILLENAGGQIEITPSAGNPDKIAIRAWNSLIDINI